MGLETWIILESRMLSGPKDWDLGITTWYLDLYSCHQSYFQVSHKITLEYAVKNIPRRYGIMFFYGAVMITCLMFGFDFVQQSTILSSILFALYRLLASNFFQII